MLHCIVSAPSEDMREGRAAIAQQMINILLLYIYIYIYIYYFISIVTLYI